MPVPAVDLEGRVALVTGGAQGIGEAIGATLAAAGAELIVADGDEGALRRVQARLGADTRRCDFTDPGQIAEVFAAARERFGRLDIVVCAQDWRPELAPLRETALDGYRRTLDVKLTASFLCVQHAARAMAGSGGRIVLVSGVEAFGAGGRGAAYDAATAALHALVRAAAVELGGERITVNAIAPGSVRGVGEGSAAERLDDRDAGPNPSGMLGEPADLARAALWLVDPDNSYVNGTVVVVDGGQTATLPLSGQEEE